MDAKSWAGVLEHPCPRGACSVREASAAQMLLGAQGLESLVTLPGTSARQQDGGIRVRPTLP